MRAEEKAIINKHSVDLWETILSLLPGIIKIIIALKPNSWVAKVIQAIQESKMKTAEELDEFRALNP